jgi:hypothetical protein
LELIMMIAQVICRNIRKITLKNTSNKISNYLPCKSKNSFYFLSPCYCVAAVVAATALLLLHGCKTRNITEKTAQ